MRPVGKVTGVVGGSVLRVVWSADFGRGEPLFVRLDGLLVPLFIEDMPRKGQVTLADADTPQRAEMLVGCELFTRGGVAEEEDFEGWEAMLGALTGKITGVPHADDVNPLFTIYIEGREVLVPAALATSVEGRIVTFDLPEGLLELNP